MAAPFPFRRREKAGFPRSIDHCVWLIALPGVSMALGLLWFGDYSPTMRVGGGALLLVVAFVTAYLLRARLVYSLRTLTNVVAAMRDGDFSIRPHATSAGDPLGGLAVEINALSDTLREQRLGALEASTLLRTTIEEMDAAIFTFDDRHRLRLANRAAVRLLARPAEQLLGRTAEELGLEGSLEGEPSRVASRTFPGGMGRFGFRRTGFRQGGRPHQLLVVTDLSRALRDEERQAWQRLLRVLGHELNNSLAPIKSVASSLEALCRRDPKPSDWEDDLRDGLTLISGRAESLNRFMQAYSQLARLPVPTLGPVDVEAWVCRVAALERRVPIRIETGPALTLVADRDQLEQLLINLLRNAADAVLEAASPVGPGPAPGPTLAAGTTTSFSSRIILRWARSGAEIELSVEDDGPGIANPANLFVPFFTTKPKGSGIGLCLCRQIAEAHEGRLTLENRVDHPGCIARLRLPLGRQRSSPEAPPPPPRSGNPRA